MGVIINDTNAAWFCARAKTGTPRLDFSAYPGPHLLGAGVHRKARRLLVAVGLPSESQVSSNGSERLLAEGRR